jgi:hypothetical protein
MSESITYIQSQRTEPEEFFELSKSGAAITVFPDNSSFLFFKGMNPISQITKCLENQSYHNHFYHFKTCKFRPSEGSIGGPHFSQDHDFDSFISNISDSEEQECVCVSHGHHIKSHFQKHYLLHDSVPLVDTEVKWNKKFNAIPIRTICTIKFRCDFTRNATRFQDHYDFTMGYLSTTDNGTTSDASFGFDEIFWNIRKTSEEDFSQKYSFELPVEDHYIEACIVRIDSLRDRFPYPAIWAVVTMKYTIKIENEQGSAIVFDSDTIRSPLSGRSCVIYLDDLINKPSERAGVVYLNMLDNTDGSDFFE